jgi:hypothetical protein
MSADDLVRFWANVDRRTDDACWPWRGSLNGSGYGSFGYARTKVGAHVAALVVDGRPPGPAMVGHHVCFNRQCVNPAHLEVRTKGENNAERHAGYVHFKARVTHCPEGHPYAGDNLVVERRADGGAARVCRTCRNRRALEGYHRRKAA